MTTINTAEVIVQEVVLPAFATVQEEFHRPEQHRFVSVTELSPTSAELTIARSSSDVGDSSDRAVALRYVLLVAFDKRAIVVKRTVNGKKGSFLGQRDAHSLRTQAIVDDIRHVWRRTEKDHEAHR